MMKKQLDDEEAVIRSTQQQPEAISVVQEQSTVPEIVHRTVHRIPAAKTPLSAE